MGSVITPQHVEIVDVASAQRHLGSGTVQQLDDCHLERWGLCMECSTPHDPAHGSEVTWLLPEPGLRLTRYLPRSRHARPEGSLLTAVRIDRDAWSWITTDLQLGLEVPERGTPRIVNSGEFASAVSDGLLSPEEADLALHTVHRTFEEISLHRDLDQWLAYRGVFTGV
ncbi:DUF402 domain-containing protein [Actinopolyspora mortivallis]|uniref:DUF402 domain-containing protein n=1 Tax=Actinopolyspora mortivallis TaxID=33906 RepID=A0A2T0GSZ5_ACTMO|nr:hypothetical protein [Actinopolyspora mortivallis]PRW62214.1 hypothetical protein CEP50_16555 [Actinopolyspora mortivallis]